MGKGKKTSADPYLIDLYRIAFRVWPLFGLKRLVRLAHRKRSGVLYCDNVLCVSEAITFSGKNVPDSLYTISHGSPAHVGVHGEPRLNGPNEASAEAMQRFQDDGTEVVFTFTPKGGKTFSIESDMYKTFDPGLRYVWGQLPENARIARWELTLDVSPYLRCGYAYCREPPWCEFESLEASGKLHRTGRPLARDLIGVEKRTGVWEWHVDNVAGGTYRMAWGLECVGLPRASKTVKLDKLATELGINPRLAKDLHNFVIICHYYVAGFRSLNKIAPEMMTDKSVLRRGIESIEEALGTKLVLRTKGKGMIQISPAGEAVLDWWSQFYMRWTPISTDLDGPTLVR